MLRFLTLVTCAAMTLWLGGLIALFTFVQAMFNTDRATAANAAPILFRVFEIYQLGLFVVAIVAQIGWRLISCSRSKKWITALLMLAGLLAVIETAFVSSRMRAMMSGEQPGGEEFRRLHSYSMMIYSTETLLLAAAACLLPAAISADALRRARLAAVRWQETSPHTQPA